MDSRCGEKAEEQARLPNENLGYGGGRGGYYRNIYILNEEAEEILKVARQVTNPNVVTVSSKVDIYREVGVEIDVLTRIATVREDLF
jgi:hypothetical protein